MEGPIKKQIINPESFETGELNPEILKVVMKKVQDLNHMHEAAFTVINYESGRRNVRANPKPTSQVENERDLADIFDKGLLSASAQSGIVDVIRSKDRRYFRKRINKGSASGDEDFYVFLEYMPENGPTIKHMKNTEWWRNMRQFPNVGLFVDIRKYKNFAKRNKEYYPSYIFRKPSGVSDNFTTYIPLTVLPARIAKEPEWFDPFENQKEKQREITIPFRVAPREFMGVLLERRTQSSEEFEAEIKRISIVMLRKYKNKPELLIPIYDESGNLLWPRRINYEDIGKLIIERDKENRN